MKKLLFAIAGAAAFSAFAADPSAGTGDIDVLGFENFDLTNPNVTGAVINRDDTGVTGTSKWLCSGDDASTVKTYGSEDVTAPNIKEPDLFASQNGGDNYLALDTSGSELQRLIPSGSQAVAATGTYIDTLVQFTPSEGAPTDLDADVKLAIWLNVDSSGATPVTNLMVRGAFYTMTDGTDSSTFNITTPTNYVLSGTYEPNTWYRLTVKNVQTLMNGMEGQYLPGFVISVDGQTLAATAAATDATAYSFLTSQMGEGDGAFTPVSGANKDLLDNKQFIPSTAVTDMGVAPTLTAVGFKGTGALDDFVVTTNEPDLLAPAIDFTLTWASGVTPVSYTIGNGEPVAIAAGATSPFSVPGLAGGETVAFTFTNADGVTKTMTATAADDGDIDSADATYTWADYLGDAVSGAYQIDDFADLDMLRKGVAAGLTTAGETFKQTANIDMTSEAAFAGIGATGQENAATLTASAFEGTYDGGNYTISNITFTNRKGSGLFNLIRGATIKDLVVDTVSYEAPFDAAKLGGAMVVGNGVNCTLQHIVTLGSNGLNNPSTYNAAGIANRLEGRGGPVLVIGCTNSAAIYSCYSKVGGICPIVQGDSTTVTFVDCANTGAIVANGTSEQITLSGKTPGMDGAAGILAYSQGGNSGDITLTNCVNTGTITGVSGTTIGTILGKMGSNGVAVSGGSAQATVASVGAGADKVSGIKFAMVDNGVATFVADDALALGGSYKVMSGNAAYAFASAGSITFDESLVSPTVTADAAYLLSQSGSGTVTYTAVLAVAQITGGAKYATLQAAVDAATAGDTVTVLADCMIAGTPLSIAKNLTIHNDHTITGAVDYAICIGATVSFEGSGKVERASGITGSAFCVGANEKTRGAITVGTSGTLNFTGLTVCGGSGGNLIKLENGTVNMNGGVLKDGKRGIKADADAGSYTSAIVINGGTITNNTDCAVMASAASADGTATVTINGGVIAGALTIDGTAGTYSITIPGTSTAKFDADQTAFCESGYETTDGDNDGWFTVSAKQAAGDYKVEIEGSDVVITPTPEDFDAIAPYLPAGVTTNDVAAVNALLATEIGSTGIPAWQAAFLGVAPTEAGLEQVAIKSVSFDAEGKVVVEMADGVTLKTGRGVDIKLILKASDDLTTWTPLQTATNTKEFTAVQPGLGETKKFYKVVVEFAAPSQP